MNDIQKVLSEPVKIDESDQDLEEELKELMTSDSYLPSVPNSEISDLEERLSDLRFPGLFIFKRELNSNCCE